MDDLNIAGIKPGDEMRPQDVIEWWRGARAKVVEELSRIDANDRVPWFHGDMSARSFATARLMESWAHGLDFYEAVDAEVEDTPRIRHIAWLAWRSLPHVFREAGEDYPSEVRVELMAPGLRQMGVRTGGLRQRDQRSGRRVVPGGGRQTQPRGCRNPQGPGSTGRTGPRTRPRSPLIEFRPRRAAGHRLARRPPFDVLGCRHGSCNQRQSPKTSPM